MIEAITNADLWLQANIEYFFIGVLAVTFLPMIFDITKNGDKK